jgi:hypothetical protein
MKVDSQTNALFAALSARHATKSAASGSGAAGSRTANAEAGDSASTGVSEFDFASMTPSDMQEAAKKLFKTGDIDLTQLFMLQNMGVPLGKMGASGEFVPLSDAQRDTFRGQSYDYLSGARDAISYIEQSGRASDPKSGYGSWQGILNVLQNRQGTPAGINLVA